MTDRENHAARTRHGRDFFFQAEDGIRDLVRSRGLGDVYKRQCVNSSGGYPYDTVLFAANPQTAIKYMFYL